MGFLNQGYNFLDDDDPFAALPPGEPPPPGTPPPLPGGGNASPWGGGDLANVLVPDDSGNGKGGSPTFAGASRPSFQFGAVPEFVPPDFVPPSFEEASQDPGFRFRLQCGTDALERSAAARGTLRTGGTLSDIMQFGQNFASQEYNNVFQRQLAAFGTKYQGAKDRFAPKFGAWQTKSQAEIAAALAQYQREFDLYRFQNQGGSGGTSALDEAYAQLEQDEPVFEYPGF